MFVPITKPARVLIVDDEHPNRDLLEVMLGQEGFVLLTASNGEEAINTTIQEQPDIILLDVMMPGTDGYQVVTSLKSNPKTTNIPIIMITALDDRNSRIFGLKAGAEDFLSKPVDRAELQARVRNLLRLKAYSDFHRKQGQLLEDEITARTAELVESEKRYRQIVESTTDGIVRIDAKATILFVNRRFAEMLGYQVPELIGRDVFSLMDNSAKALADESLKNRDQGKAEMRDFTFLRKNGRELTVNLASTPLFDESGTYAGSLTSARDMTEQKNLIAQLTVSDRMASVGTLAAGVAHEINNPLAALIANLDFATHALSKFAQEARTPTPEREANKPPSGTWRVTQLYDVGESLSEAKECADRVRNIVRDLKIFSRSEEDKTNAIDIRSVLESSLRMAWNEIRHRARLVKEYSDVPPVEGNDGRLGQVFLNLIVNAAQSMPEGGAHKNEIRVVTKQDTQDQVVIEIHDTGPGIPENIIPRIFDPFFTTKPIGEGTGLGLAICHRIVTGLGGQLTVKSQVGKGTIFRVILPVAKSDIEQEEKVLPAPATVLPRRGQILIVDDEVILGKVLCRMLAQEHDVTVVTKAPEALKLVSQGDSFDVIFCDLMMPEMTGMDLYTEFLRIAPKQAENMIFMTGGVFTSRARAFLEEVRNPRIEKPFDTGSLKALIYAMLRQVK